MLYKTLKHKTNKVLLVLFLQQALSKTKFSSTGNLNRAELFLCIFPKRIYVWQAKL